MLINGSSKYLVSVANSGPFLQIQISEVPIALPVLVRIKGSLTENPVQDAPDLNSKWKWVVNLHRQRIQITFDLGNRRGDLLNG